MVVEVVVVVVLPIAVAFTYVRFCYCVVGVVLSIIFCGFLFFVCSFPLCCFCFNRLVFGVDLNVRTLLVTFIYNRQCN